MDESKSRIRELARELVKQLPAIVVGALIGALAGEMLRSRGSKEEASVKALAEHNHDAEIKRQSANGQYWNLIFENTCEGDVYLSVRYNALDGYRTVYGWPHVKPHQSSRPVAATTSNDFEFTVLVPRGWKWKAGNPTIEKDVSRTSAFEYIDDLRYWRGGYFVLPGSVRATFQEVHIPIGTPFGDYKTTIACSKSD